MAIFITQLIYIKPGSEKIFDEFEAVAIPLITRYCGKLLLRVRPELKNYVEKIIPEPYEIHLVEFESDEWFKKFLADETRKKYLHLKESSIKSTLLIKGEEI